MSNQNVKFYNKINKLKYFFNLIKKLFYKKPKLFLSIIIFLIIFLLLGIPYTNWGLWVDDPGLIWHSQISNWKDLLNFFTNKGMTTLYNPSNYIIPRQSFFTVRYVPFYYIFLLIQTFLFGFSPYCYFLVIIFLHAINAIILFNIFYLLQKNSILAFIGAIYFAFHPSLCTWLGWISTQYYQLELLFFLLILIFLKKYLDKERFIFYFLSVFCYLLCLFTREILVVLPIWLFFALYFYPFNKKKDKNHFKEILYNFKITLGFWIVCIFYLLVKLYFYSINLGKWKEPEIIQINLFKVLLLIKYRFFEFVTLVSNLANQSLYFLPGGNRILKGFLIIIFFIPLILLFFKNTKKKYIIFFVFSIFFFLWPAFLKLYVARYLYLVLPLYIFILLLLVQFYNSKTLAFNLKINKIFIGVFSLLVLVNIIFLLSALNSREKFLYQREQVLKELVVSEKIKNRAICFIGLPFNNFYTGLAQHMWILGINRNVPIYYDNRTWIYTNNHLSKNYLKIERKKNKFRLITQNYKKLCFNTIGEMIMGTLVVNENKNDCITDITLIIDKKFLKQDPVFISWDYEKDKFFVLD